jgi:hypothetical protein
MTKWKNFQQSRMLSPEDRRAFNRWLTGNAVVAFALAAGLVAMVMANSNTGPRDAIVAGSKMAPDIVVAAHK